MNIQPTAFQRTDITRRQLRAEDPEAVRALDRYGGDSVGTTWTGDAV